MLTSVMYYSYRQEL